MHRGFDVVMLDLDHQAQLRGARLTKTRDLLRCEREERGRCEVLPAPEDADEPAVRRHRLHRQARQGLLQLRLLGAFFL